MTLTLKPGLYLVIGEDTICNGYVYSAAPFLVFLPAENTEANEWNYDVTVMPKIQNKDPYRGAIPTLPSRH